jgi:metal-responsive CopG/Arc/MetJ family transcriptional regulator
LQIRDLEARVEVLSGDKDERSELVMLLVRNLLKENKDLRNLVKSMAGFIGEGG